MKLAFLLSVAVYLGLACGSKAASLIYPAPTAIGYGYLGVEQNPGNTGFYGVGGSGPSIPITGAGTFNEIFPVNGGFAQANVTLQLGPQGFSASGSVSSPGGQPFNCELGLPFSLDQAGTMLVNLSDLKNSTGLTGIGAAFYQLILYAPSVLTGVQLVGASTQPFAGNEPFFGMNDKPGGPPSTHGPAGASYQMNIEISVSGQAPSSADFSFSAQIVPEPSSLALLILGGVLLAGRITVSVPRTTGHNARCEQPILRDPSTVSQTVIT
jgi:hypothetical protein